MNSKCEVVNAKCGVRAVVQVHVGAAAVLFSELRVRDEGISQERGEQSREVAITATAETVQQKQMREMLRRDAHMRTEKNEVCKM